MSSDLEIIVLAAGKGTRMNSDLPKVLHCVCGVSLLERTIRACLSLNPTRLVVVAGFRHDLVESEISRLQKIYTDIKLSTVIQEPQLGTGHAAKIGLSALDSENKNSKVLILPSDIPLINKDILTEFVEESSEYYLAFLSCDHPEPAAFGRVIRDEDDAVTGIVELKDCTDEQIQISEINTSIYLIDKTFLKSSLEDLKPNNKQQEYYLTDLVSLAVMEGKQVEGLVTDDFHEVSGANDRAELAELEAIRRTEIVYSLMKNGVGFQDPTCVYIDEDVEIKRGATIGAGVTLSGTTKISENAVVEGYSYLKDALVSEGAHIKQHCYIENAVIGENAQIGPFAHLRPGTILDSNVKIGNFVETKNTRLGKGSKANHLTYLGDTTVGENSNIGAGTITCNYDGKNKHQTKIGDNCFVGSDSILVAPVLINNDSYVGAGSVITKEVPSGSLALGRAKQTIIEGWVAKKTSKNKD